jgi:hypothetical protein
VTALSFTNDKKEVSGVKMKRKHEVALTTTMVDKEEEEHDGETVLADEKEEEERGNSSYHQPLTKELRDDELWRRIGRFLTPASLVHLQRTCRRFHTLLTDAAFVESYIRAAVRHQSQQHRRCTLHGPMMMMTMGEEDDEEQQDQPEEEIRTLGQLALVQQMRAAGLFHENRIGFQFASLEIEDDDEREYDEEESLVMISSFLDDDGGVNNNNSHADGGVVEVEVDEPVVVGTTTTETTTVMVHGSRQRLQAVHDISTRFRRCRGGGGHSITDLTIVIESHCGRAAPGRVARQFSIDRGRRMAEYFVAKQQQQQQHKTSYDDDDDANDRSNGSNLLGSNNNNNNDDNVAITTRGWGRTVADVLATATGASSLDRQQHHPYGALARSGKGWVELYLSWDGATFPRRPSYYDGIPVPDNLVVDEI